MSRTTKRSGAYSRRQLDEELAKYPWFKPAALEIFGGKYDPALLRFPLKMFAGKEPASDIRDWEAIRSWASSLVGTPGIFLQANS